jgi:hypothetical protein
VPKKQAEILHRSNEQEGSSVCGIGPSDKSSTERRGEMPFVTSGESPIVSLIDQMNAALKEAGIERSSFEKYTVYSLRAVNALRNGVVQWC